MKKKDPKYVPEKLPKRTPKEPRKSFTLKNEK